MFTSFIFRHLMYILSCTTLINAVLMHNKNKKRLKRRYIKLPLIFLCIEKSTAPSDREQSVQHTRFSAEYMKSSSCFLCLLAVTFHYITSGLSSHIKMWSFKSNNREHWPLRTSGHPVWGSPRGSSCSSWGTSLLLGSLRCLTARYGRSWGTFSCLREPGLLLQRTAGMTTQRKNVVSLRSDIQQPYIHMKKTKQTKKASDYLCYRTTDLRYALLWSVA